MPDHPQTILIATDLSARSDRPMERAILLADQLDAALTSAVGNIAMAAFRAWGSKG